jgi:lysophospholipase L1-like esterase
MNWETILCIGDSITIGSRSYLGYPEYCGNFLAKETQKNWNVINHAVSGYTTIDIARSIDKNFEALKTAKPDIATIMIGTNDLKLNLSLDKFKIAYELLVVKTKLIIGTNNIILLQIPLLMSGVMLPYNIAMNDTIVEYNKAIKDIANTFGLLCKTLICHDNHFYDGVHLNEMGSENFGNQISNFILEIRKK